MKGKVRASVKVAFFAVAAAVAFAAAPAHATYDFVYTSDDDSPGTISEEFVVNGSTITSFTAIGTGFTGPYSDFNGYLASGPANGLGFSYVSPTNFMIQVYSGDYSFFFDNEVGSGNSQVSNGEVTDVGTATVTAVPEMGTWAYLILGFAALSLRGKSIWRGLSRWSSRLLGSARAPAAA